MDELRLTLLLVVAAVALGVTVRDQFGRRRRMAVRVAAVTDREPVLDVASMVAEPPHGDGDDRPPARPAPRAPPASQQVELPFGTAPEDPTDLRRGAHELIVSVVVMCPGAEPFAADAVRAALEEAGLGFGAMQIFHHFGLGTADESRPVFSVARALEPGKFDPYRQASFETPGLVLFMRLPGRQDGAVVLELMLATAEQLAARLGGVVLDEAREPLDAGRVADLRESVAVFEHHRRRDADRARRGEDA